MAERADNTISPEGGLQPLTRSPLPGGKISNPVGCLLCLCRTCCGSVFKNSRPCIFFKTSFKPMLYFLVTIKTKGDLGNLNNLRCPGYCRIIDGILSMVEYSGNMLYLLLGV